MDKVANFGDIFRYGEDDYVYLAYAPDTEIVYAAKILDTDFSSQLQKRHEVAQKSDRYNPRDPRFCFVPLTSQDFEDRLCHLARTDHNVEISSIYGRLNGDDVEDIKKEISEGPVAPRLKELIQAMS